MLVGGVVLMACDDPGERMGDGDRLAEARCAAAEDRPAG